MTVCAEHASKPDMRGTNKGSSSKLDYARVAIESHVVELHTHVSTRAETTHKSCGSTCHLQLCKQHTTLV